MNATLETIRECVAAVVFVTGSGAVLFLVLVGLMKWWGQPK